MPRRRKVQIVKGPKRIVGQGLTMKVVQTDFCGECGRRLKSASTQKPHKVVAKVCDNIEEHKYGQIYFWPLKKVVMMTT
jgi:hypothetical protein